MTSGRPRSADVGTLIDRYDAAGNAQDLDAIASMHDDTIVFHNHTVGERVARDRSTQLSVGACRCTPYGGS
jgi:ketosteroid isomerase-like protein